MRRARSGFTLIELLIVVVIIGILASIAIPKFGSTKGKAYLAAMKSDLRNLATAQEAYLYDFATYYQGAVPGAGIAYSVTPGVTVTISNVSVSGWAATTSHI
ncbi:MAG: type II secretion system protein, partial [Gemmatimonadetes bacterium]|nr:type II secretion system protein [Gemmatimonadota bacterium]